MGIGSWLARIISPNTQRYIVRPSATRCNDVLCMQERRRKAVEKHKRRKQEEELLRPLKEAERKRRYAQAQ